MTRKQRRLERIAAIRREYAVALAAAEGLEERFRKNPRALDDERLKFGDYKSYRDNLEPTYLVRMFAEFEVGLREAWEFAFRRTTHPTTHDLIVSIAAQRQIPKNWLDRVHQVRAYRNALVHEGAEDVPPIGIEDARGHLRRFFSMLPHQW